MWLCFTSSGGWAKSKPPPCSEAQLTWGSLVSCDHAATAWSIPWNPEWGKRSSGHDQHISNHLASPQCQNPAGKASPLLCQGAQHGCSFPTLPHSCPGASSWGIQVTYTCQTSTEHEPGCPTLRFTPGSKRKSGSQVSFPVCVIWQVCWWSYSKPLPARFWRYCH